MLSDTNTQMGRAHTRKKNELNEFTLMTLMNDGIYEPSSY